MNEYALIIYTGGAIRPHVNEAGELVTFSSFDEALKQEEQLSKELGATVRTISIMDAE